MKLVYLFHWYQWTTMLPAGIIVVVNTLRSQCLLHASIVYKQQNLVTPCAHNVMTQLQIPVRATLLYVLHILLNLFQKCSTLVFLLFLVGRGCGRLQRTEMKFIQEVLVL